MNHQCQLPLPEALLSLVCRLYMINQRTRATMDPSVASTTKIHRAGLSTIPGCAWAAGAMVITENPKVRGGSEGNKLINYLKRKTFYILNSCKNPSYDIGNEHKLGFINID